MSKKALYRFFVPYVRKNGVPIPDEHRKSFFKVVEEESCKLNDGFTTYEAKGGYRPKNNKEIVRENITIFETYGACPLPDKRLHHCREYLAQESLLVAVFEDGKIEYLEYKGKKTSAIYCDLDFTKEEVEKAMKSDESVEDFFRRKAEQQNINADMEDFRLEWSDLMKKARKEVKKHG